MYVSHDPLLEFWGPLNISRTVEDKTSSISRRWTAVSTNEKCKIRSKGVMWGSRFWPTFGILEPPNISGTVESRKLKFGKKMDGSEYYERNAKLGQKGSCGATWPTFAILGPPLSAKRLRLEIQIWHRYWWQCVLTTSSLFHFYRAAWNATRS